MKEKFSELIKDPDLERLELELKNPNFFSILKLENREIRHSNFLGWLLDPNGSHHLGDIFLRWFLKDVFSSGKCRSIDEFIIDGYNLSDLKVYREWSNIDILLVSRDFVVVIENKIFSKEHSNQLTRYRSIINSNYPNHEKIFVYITPNGDEPENEEDLLTYCIYSYDEIRKNINTILDIYSSSISDRSKIYLEDYITILGRDIMKDHESIELANQIYLNHKEALDFIFQHKLDRASQVHELGIKAVESEGLIKVGMSKNKRTIRFTTKILNEIIPKTGEGRGGWKTNESFAFELTIYESRISFITVISPGNESNREVLIDILKNIQGYKEKSNSGWIINIRNNYKKEIFSEDLLDEEVIDIFRDIIQKNKDVIQSIESEMVLNKHRFKNSII